MLYNWFFKYFFEILREITEKQNSSQKVDAKTTVSSVLFNFVEWYDVKK
jgi:hypothetical protein